MTTPLIDENGLRVAVVSVDEAVGRDWTADPFAADLIRVTDPDHSDLAALTDARFVLTPSWITWLAGPGPDEETFLAQLNKCERSSMRQSRRDVRDRGLVLTVSPALNERTFDDFMKLYTEQIACMRNGVLFAARWRETLLAQPDHFFAVRATEPDGTPAGICICADRPDDIAVRVAFAAQAAAERARGRLVRAMYLTAFQEARDRRRALVSLGSDPSLYGHIAQPGLFRFKARMGFRPVPTRFLDTQEPDRSELVLSLARLSEPTLLVGYAAPPPRDHPGGLPDVRLQVHLLTTAKDADTAPFRVPLLAEPRHRTVPS